MAKERIAIDITKRKISILTGQKMGISSYEEIETPKGSYEKDRILNVEMIADALNPIIKKKKTREVYFVLRGEDLITRHIELPQMKEEAIEDTVDFELRQVLGDRVDNLYFDFEITNPKEEATGKMGIIIVAAEKEKVSSYIALADKLGVKIKGLDSYVTCAGRVLKQLNRQKIGKIKNVGLIDLDAESSAITITAFDKIALERYQSFGLENASMGNSNNLAEYERFLSTLDLSRLSEDSEEPVHRIMQMIITQFSNIIQYALTGHSKKSLDIIFLSGSARYVRGLDQYISSYLSANVSGPLMFQDLKLKVKVPKNVELADNVYTYGLLLRKE